MQGEMLDLMQLTQGRPRSQRILRRRHCSHERAGRRRFFSALADGWCIEDAAAVESEANGADEAGATSVVSAAGPSWPGRASSGSARKKLGWFSDKGGVGAMVLRLHRKTEPNDLKPGRKEGENAKSADGESCATQRNSRRQGFYLRNAVAVGEKREALFSDYDASAARSYRQIEISAAVLGADWLLGSQKTEGAAKSPRPTYTDASRTPGEDILPAS